jgi:hypothetical protein
MRVVPLQEMQHVGEFVAAVRDLGAGLRRRTQPLPQAGFNLGNLGSRLRQSYRGSLTGSVRNSPSRSI